MAKKEGGQPGNDNARKWWKLDGLIIGHRLVQWIRKKGFGQIYVEEFFFIENDFPENIEISLKSADDSPLYNKKTMEKYGFKTKKSLNEFFNENKMSLDESFCGLYRKSLKIQELKLKIGASFKNIDPGTAKFLLMNNHGYTDKHDNTSNGEKVDNKIEVSIIKADRSHD